MHIVSKSISETAEFAQKILASLTPKTGATILALHGDLGSGKTTFTQELGKLLGLKNPLQSPTFVIIKSYKLQVKSYKLLVHIDAYRLEKPEELARLGFERIISDPGNLVVIEWAERVAPLLPQDVLHIQCTFVDETTRKIEVVE